MSQHIFNTTRNGDDIHVMIGWDRPMQCLFAYVENVSAGDDDENACLLETMGRRPSLAEIREALEGLTLDVPESLFEEVEKDQAANMGNRVMVHGEECDEPQLRTDRFDWPMPDGSLVAVRLVLTVYDNDALQLTAVQDSPEGAQPWAKCSVAIRGEQGDIVMPDSPDELFIKDYSECEGLFAALVSQGYLHDTGKRVGSLGAFVEFPVGKLTQKGKGLASTYFEGKGL